MWRTGAIFLLVGVSFCGVTAWARQWTSRSGSFQVEAELVEAGDDYVVLKRDDNGKKIRVPLAELSLADVLYLREAKKSAESSSTSGKSAPPMPKTASPAANEKSQPPLAVEGKTGWQAAPDPSPEAWKRPVSSKLKIPVPTALDDDVVLFSGATSPFVAVGSNYYKDGIREMWDVRSGKRVGAIRGEISNVFKVATSPDGQRLACYRNSPSSIEVWSYKTGKRESQIPLEKSGVEQLNFVGSDRLATRGTTYQSVDIWSVETGKRERTFKLAGYDGPYASSPQGNYLATVKEDLTTNLFDLRNGVLAGEAKFDAAKFKKLLLPKPHVIDFSADGREFAVIMHAVQDVHVLCWSTTDGSLIAEIALGKHSELSGSHGNESGEPIIQWVADRGWILFGMFYLDRATNVVTQFTEWVHRRPFRVLDDKRALIVSGTKDKPIVAVADLPVKHFDEAVKVAKTGGTATDVGLPPLSQPDRTVIVQKEFGDETTPHAVVNWSEQHPPQKSAKADLGKSFTRVERTFVAANQPHLLLVDGELDEEKPGGRPGDLYVSVSDVYDLKNGKRLSRLQDTFPREATDFSPSGKFVIFTHITEGKRVDLYDLQAGRHVVGFKPYEDGPDPDASMVNNNVGFADDEHIWTVNHHGKLVLWRIDGCRAVYSMDVGRVAKAFSDRSRRYLAVGWSEGIRIVEPLSGRTSAVLPLPVSDGVSVLTDGAFRADGQQMVAIFNGETQSRLVVWELASQKLLCDLPVPYTAQRVRWSGPDHVTLFNWHTKQDAKEKGRHFQETLVSVNAARVAWQYILDLGTDAVDGPDDRCWYFARDLGGPVCRLHAVALPDAKAQAYLTSSPAPKPLFGPGLPVALDVKIGSLPDGVEDYRAREDALVKQLQDHGTQAMEKRGIQVAPMADVTLHATIKKLTQEDVVLIRSRFPGFDSGLILRYSVIHARLSLEMKNGVVLWEEEKLVEPEKARAEEVRKLKGVPASAARQLVQWDLAKQWCLEVPLPTSLYSPDASRGGGESLLTTAGIRFVAQNPTGKN